jgi:PAS domain S-box-containing protein
MATPRNPAARRLGALVQRAADPIFQLDEAGCLVFVNAAWEQFTGYSADHVLGLACQGPVPMPESGLEALAAGLCPSPELGPAPYSVDTLLVDAAGERKEVSIAFVPFNGTAGGGLGHLGVIRPRAAGSTPAAPHHKLRGELLALRERLRRKRLGTNLIGSGVAHQRVMRQIELVAANLAPVVIVGEEGTGKRTVARAIHDRSPRAAGACLVFDVEASGAEAVAHMLFAADGESAEPAAWSVPADSTLVVGPLAELPRDLQAQLVTRVETSVDPAGPRLVFTSRIEPARLLEAGTLRADFYYLVTSQSIELAPLRERLDELPLLAQHALEWLNARSGQMVAGFSTEAIDVLRAYDWPGNLRELSRVVQAAHERQPAGLITPSDLPAAIRGAWGGAYTPAAPAPLPALDSALESVERRLIEHALQTARHNKSRAAEILSISRPRLYRRMKDLGIPDLPEG